MDLADPADWAVLMARVGLWDQPELQDRLGWPDQEDLAVPRDPVDQVEFLVQVDLKAPADQLDRTDQPDQLAQGDQPDQQVRVDRVAQADWAVRVD